MTIIDNRLWSEQELVKMVALAERLGFSDDAKYFNRLLLEYTLPEEYVEYKGVSTKVKDIPDDYVQDLLGYGHIGRQGRKIHPGFPILPSQCVWGDRDWIWINDEQNLVCPRCGLDGT